ncbi:MAG: hypothetical protein Q4C82_02205 [Eubacteriales bacterium]|nr:hypothetical protein [Eubacteriales bacterium]
MSILKRIASTALALTLVAGSLGMTSQAAGKADNGDYKATVHFHKAGTTDPSESTYSMCDSIFVHEADVTLTDDTATVTFYVAYPVPSFPAQGTEGTITDVKMTVDGVEYEATSDITTKPTKVFDTTGAIFGITAGDELTTQVLTVELPRSAVADFETGIETEAYVNVVMNSTQKFVMTLDGVRNPAVESIQDSMDITAEVAAAEASYSVTIPESVAIGTLSAEQDTTKEYSVALEASNLGEGIVEISTDAAGTLTSGSNTLAFANSFGTQSAGENATLTGEITIKAADVAAAAAGNYTGTANFTISYFE